ncbi:MAG: efflux RND transporter periplasmic adaptor subunit [Bacteroidetes bacterium]|nr:efflux RND transporter periplasmic adaptor subunit [Bacteroidota bacterium]
MKKIVPGLLCSLIVMSLLYTACQQAATVPDAKATPTAVNPQTRLHLQAHELELAGIRLGSTTPRPMEEVLRVNGRVKLPPSQHAQLSSPIGGTLHALYVQEGQYVGKGAVLAHIQSMEFIQMQEDYLSVQQQRLLAGQELERQQMLAEASATAGKTLQQAQTEYDRLGVRYEALRTRLQVLGIQPERLRADNLLPYLPLFAPQAGVVQQLQGKIGAYIQPEVPLMQLMGRSQLQIDLQIFPQYIPRVRSGQQVRIYFPGQTQVVWQGQLGTLDAAITEQAPYLLAHIQVPAHQTALAGGMLVYADVVLQTHAMLPTLPDAAFIDVGDSTYLYAADSLADGVYLQRLAVERGAASQGYTALMDTIPLHKRTRFVVSGARMLMDMNSSQEE